MLVIMWAMWRISQSLASGFCPLALCPAEAHGWAMTSIPQNNPPLAIALMLLATVFIAGTSLLAKMIGTGMLGAPLHPMVVSFGRFVFASAVFWSAAAVIRPRFGKVHWGLHVTRTSFGWLGVTCMFAAVAYIPLADATAISFLNPVFAMLFAIPLLGEKVGPWRWVAAAICFTGGVILIRPGAGALEWGALIALTSALALGLEVIAIKRLTGREKPLQILLVNNGIGLCIASVAASFVWSAPTLAQWAALAGIGVLMAGAQTCFLNSMARADASLVAPFSYATLIFATLYDAVLFGVIPEALSLIGAAIIISGALLLAWRETLARRRAGNSPS